MRKSIILLFAYSLYVIYLPSYSNAESNINLTMPPVLAAAIKTPAPFAFTPIYDVPHNSYITSNAIVVKGIRGEAVISIIGGSYSIDDGNFVSVEGTVIEGQKVNVLVMSSYASGESKSCTLTIGNTNASFTVTTIIPPRTQDCSDGQVTVMWNGKMWQRCTNDAAYTPEQAAQYCHNLVLGGYDDWEYPYHLDLFSIKVCDNGSPNYLYSSCDAGGYGPFTAPTIDPIFECTPDVYFFGENPLAGPGYDHWGLDFATGASVGVTEMAKIRCVRDPN